MFIKWFVAHRSLILTIVGGVCVAALVTAFAITSTGFTAQQLNLNDSSVWVANGTQQAIGRANTTVKQLNSVVSTTGSDLDVLQNSSTVMLVDNADSKLQVIDPSTSTVSQTVPLPPNLPQVFLSQNNVVIVAAGTGQVWITPIAQISTFNAQAAPTLSLGPNVVASMDSDGTLFIYSPSAKHVVRVQPDVSQEVVGNPDTLSLPVKDTFQITSVDAQWAVLDATTGRVYVNGGSASLKGTVAAKSPSIQLASATGDRILVAGSAGLVALSMGASTPTTLLRGQSGTATRPASVSGCDYAAWTGGRAWRQCTGDPADGVTMPLSAVPSGAKLTLRSNGSRVVLNDSRSGATWAVQSGGQLINNWNDLIAPKDQQQQQQKKDEDTPPDVEKQQLPPVAVDDNLGARPGRASVLPVLLNDYDPNGDVIAITGDTGIPQADGRVDVINNHQELQITLASGASGMLSFRYTITDGRGGSASATVTVTVRTQGENSAPIQVQNSKTTVVQGGRVTTQVLGDWEDPDGDPMYVTSAAVSAPDSISYTPDGTLVYSDGGTTSGIKTVSVTVSDGKAETTGSLSVTVRAAGKVPIIADPFLQIATAGQPLTISPLAHVRGGNGPLRLGNVPAKADVTITPSYDAGTFQFTSTTVGTHYLNYVVTDGSQSLTGVVRVDVVAPPESNTKPITIPKTVFVRALLSATVDVADSDIDPAGGVLLVTGISNLDPTSGITAEILQQQSVRVRAAKPLDAPVTFEYTVTNGLASSTGSITVVEIPTPTNLQPPIANPDSITVRTNAAIDIPVLANDSDPDGETLTLVPTLPQNVPAGAGLLFTSGDVLRYLAPSHPGNYTAIYAVAGPDGQTARAQVKIAVREVDANTNNPPVPENLTSRVLAGGTVQIDVPLSGIDPDGDTVQLLGVQTNPQKGIVTAVGPHTITYQAGDYSTGTDTFTYGVTDALGARATGTVRVGIAAKPSGAPNPVATIDEVTVRPGVTVSVQVLANDSDPDDSPLHVVSVKPQDKGTKATIEGGTIVDVTPPTTPGLYGLIYTIANETGGQSTAFIRVTVDPKAPLSVPIASDTVLTLNDILDRTTVDVNVLANVFYADGANDSVGISVYPGYGNTAQVTASKHIVVTVTAHSQIIPFKVTNPEDPSIFTYAFIWVPGTDDALPQINRTAPALSVVSGSKLTIPLNDYVIAAQGKKVQLTDTSSVTATHADGSPLVVDNRTLQFTSADQYFGPASISFQVTDGASPTDPNGRKAILTLPIKVLPKTNQPPVFIGGLINFEPGSSVDVDLVKLTNYPYQNDLGQLVYNIVTPVVPGFTTSLSGQHLTIKANESVDKGSTGELDIGVRDSNSTGTAGSIQLVVVPSTKPLAVPAPDSAIVQRGQTTTIDVLANDNATNPFPDTPLKVIAIRGLDGGSLPAGLTVTPSADRSKLTVTASSGASPGDTTLQYEVADATNDPARYVWGNVTISVEDRPDPVTNVRTTSFSDRQLILNWNNGAANNSPILDYQVVETDATTGHTISTTTCAGPLCAITTPGNGPGNSVRLAVIARNAIGSSDPTSNPGPIWSDIIPAAPTSLGSTPLDHGLDITWQAPPPTGGSAITSYVISVDGTSPRTVDANTFEVQVTDPAIANGSAVNYSVSAHNSAFASLATWNSASGTGFPAGPPLYQPSSPPVASAVGDDGTTAQLSWNTSFNANGAAITDYRAAVFNAGDSAPSCSPTVGQDAGTALTTTFTGLQANNQYNFIVFAFNAMGCGTSDIVTLTVRPVPGTVTAIASSGPSSSGTNIWDFRINSATIASGSSTTDSFEYQLSSTTPGSSVDGSTYGPLNYGQLVTTTNGSQYGNDIQIEVRACKHYPESTQCSDNWSAPFELGVPVANTDLPSLSFSHPDFNLLGPAVNGTWTWSAGIAQGAYDTITYDCGNGAQTLDPSNPGSCTASETSDLSQDFPPLTISIGVNGHHYVRTYVWTNYD